MATTSRTGMIILGLVWVATLSVGGTVLAAGGAHRHDDSDDHTPMGGSMMGGDGTWVDHDPMMDPSAMARWMWEHMSQHMGVSAPEAEPETEAAEGPASETPSDEPESAE